MTIPIKPAIILPDVPRLKRLAIILPIPIEASFAMPVPPKNPIALSGFAPCIEFGLKEVTSTKLAEEKILKIRKRSTYIISIKKPAIANEKVTKTRAVIILGIWF